MKKTILFGDKGEGKTSYVVDQALKKQVEGHDVLILVPTENDAKRIGDKLVFHSYLPDVKHAGSTSGMESLKGAAYDFVFVDDWFRYDNPLKVLEVVQHILNRSAGPGEAIFTLDGTEFDVRHLGKFGEYSSQGHMEEIDSFEVLNNIKLEVCAVDDAAENREKEWYITINNTGAVEIGEKYVEGIRDMFDIPEEATWGITVDDMNRIQLTFTLWRDNSE